MCKYDTVWMGRREITEQQAHWSPALVTEILASQSAKGIARNDSDKFFPLLKKVFAFRQLEKECTFASLSLHLIPSPFLGS